MRLPSPKVGGAGSATVVNADRMRDRLRASMAPTARRALVRWRHVGLRRRDVALVSYPKSGSTWLRFIVAHALGGREVDFDSIRRIVPPVGRQRHAPALVPGGHRLVRSHEPLRRLPESACERVIYLVRDGRDVALSYMRHLERLGAFHGSFAEFVPLFVAGAVDNYGTWVDHVTGAKEARDQKRRSVVVVRYEDLRRDTVTTLEGVLRFLGADPSASLLSDVVAANNRARMRAKESDSSLLRSQSRSDIPFVSSGTGPRWRDLLDDDDLQAFQDALAPGLAAWDYPLTAG